MKAKLFGQSLFAGLRQLFSIRYISVFSVINTGLRFLCITPAIFHVQQSLTTLFWQTTGYILRIFWTSSCFSFLRSLPSLSPSRWFIPASIIKKHFCFPYLDGKGISLRFLCLLQFISNLFRSFTAFLHTYSISLQDEGRSRLLETYTASNKADETSGDICADWKASF